MRNELLHLHLPRPIALIGLGVSGEAVLRLLVKAGVPRSEIFTFDQKKSEKMNSEKGADFDDPNELLAHKPQTLCVSPGVSLKTGWIRTAIQSGLRLSSELEIAFSFITNEKVIAITGSVGKSTTTALLGEGARIMDSRSFCGGNLGKPLADYACELIDGNAPAKYVLLELSSYQLENFSNLKADASIFTFLSPNHLERYSSLQEYYDTKLKLLEMTHQWVIVNSSGGDNISQIKSLEKKYSLLNFSFVARSNVHCNKKPRLVGEHNLDNLAVALTLAEQLNWSVAAKEAMMDFSGLPHRMENIGQFRNILFINDSKATTMDSVLQAYKSICSLTQGTIHLLLGGRDKNLPWDQLAILQNERLLKAHFFGEYAAQAQAQTGIPGTVHPTLSQCLESLSAKVYAQDVVLLSPGGTSLDEFKNFEDRGKFFRNWVLAKFQD